MASTSSAFVGADNNDDVENKPSASDPPSSPFVTTSDVINQLNKQLSGLSSADPGDEGTDRHRQQPRFELQKRLADGSAVPASQEEIAAADFKAKLEQSAAFVSQLATSTDRQYWAEQQRLMGNSYFGRGDYKSAMDVYLTCLVVKENTADFVNQTLMPILNNLAQCTLQLGMYKKTVVFCEIALEEARKIRNDRIQGHEDDTRDGEHSRLGGEIPGVDPIAVCKIYYKLAKAQRLSGNYGEARYALNSAIECLDVTLQGIDGTPATSCDLSSSSLAPYRQAIQKEYRHLDVAEREARKIRQQQKRAMQKALSHRRSNSPSNLASNGNAGSLYETSSSARSEPRKFSTLRARKTASASQRPPAPSSSQNRQHLERTYTDAPSRLSTYNQYYWSVVARVTAFLLAILGDDEGGEKRETRPVDGTEKRASRVN